MTKVVCIVYDVVVVAPMVGKVVADMAYETKVILQALAEISCRENAKNVYEAIARMANVEGLVLMSFDEAREALLKSSAE